MTEPNYAARAQAVGSICAQWAYVEYMLANTIWWLLKIDRETGMIVTGGLDIIPRVNMALTLAKHLKAPKNLVDTLTSARDAIRRTIDRRNEAVHGVQFSRAGDSAVLVEMHRGKGNRQKKSLSLDDLTGTNEEIMAIRESLISTLEPLGINVE